MTERMLQPFFSDDITNWPVLRNLSSIMKTMDHAGLSVWEEEGEIVVEVAVPGVRSDQTNIMFENGVLTIQAARREEKEDKARKYYHKADSSFYYSLRVPGEVDDVAEPEAKIENGVLQVRFRKHRKSTPRKIAVK